MKQGRWWLVLACCTVLWACNEYQRRETSGAPVKGKWIEDPRGNVMPDPQTSGLKIWRKHLLSISDGSAQASQRLKLHVIEPDTATLKAPIVLTLSEKVENSCFGQYLADKPDFEALVVNPADDNEVLLVTEDATRTGVLTAECATRFAGSGSTEYPTVLVRVRIQSDTVGVMTHVRPLRFAADFAVGDFPNDGIEGMAMSPRGDVYLGLEKDSSSQPRIFKLTLDQDFWEQDGFADVFDPELRLPTFEGGNHPINGMDYLALEDGREFLVAAARNDDQIWFVDISGEYDTVIEQIRFMAPNRAGEEACGDWHVMDNASLEGLAVDKGKLWLVNDPWKRHYKENILCENNREAYEAMAPLLFNMPLDSAKLPGKTN